MKLPFEIIPSSNHGGYATLMKIGRHNGMALTERAETPREALRNGLRETIFACKQGHGGKRILANAEKALADLNTSEGRTNPLVRIEADGTRVVRKNNRVYRIAPGTMPAGKYAPFHSRVDMFKGKKDPRKSKWFAEAVREGRKNPTPPGQYAQRLSRLINRSLGHQRKKPAGHSYGKAVQARLQRAALRLNQKKDLQISLRMFPNTVADDWTWDAQRRKWVVDFSDAERRHKEKFPDRRNPPYRYLDWTEWVQGKCEVWAKNFIAKNGGEAVWIDDLPGHEKLPDFIDHQVVVKDGKYYDAINPKGVDDWHDLSFVKWTLDGSIAKRCEKSAAKDVVKEAEQGAIRHGCSGMAGNLTLPPSRRNPAGDGLHWRGTKQAIPAGTRVALKKIRGSTGTVEDSKDWAGEDPRIWIHVKWDDVPAVNHYARGRVTSLHKDKLIRLSKTVRKNPSTGVYALAIKAQYNTLTLNDILPFVDLATNIDINGASYYYYDACEKACRLPDFQLDVGDDVIACRRGHNKKMECRILIRSGLKKVGAGGVYDKVEASEMHNLSKKGEKKIITALFARVKGVKPYYSSNSSSSFSFTRSGLP